MISMAERIFVLDANIVSKLQPGRNQVLWDRVAAHQSDIMYLPEPVIFEVERGHSHRQATRQLRSFRELIIPLFPIIRPRLLDWRLAAELWGDARRRGRQLSDVDVLLGALALRLGGVLVTDDNDFAHLPLVPG
jgi:predicted nucleic acid-binding protein